MFNLRQIARVAYKGVQRPLRHYYNSLRDGSPKLLVLVYHNILPRFIYDPFNSVVSLDTFHRQLEVLSRRYPIISLDSAVKQCREEKAKDKIQIVLTFDDGFRNNYEFAYPLLKKMGIPATFFLVTDYVNNGKPLWCSEAARIISSSGIGRVKLNDRYIIKRPAQSRLSFIFSAIKKMKALESNEIEGALSILRKDAGDSVPGITGQCLKWEQAREMNENGMEIGAHGLSHRSLSMLPFEEAKHEIRLSRGIIEKNTMRPCRHFAFPFGSRNDFNQNLIDYAKESGFETCLSNIHGYNYVNKDLFCFNRIIMEEMTDVAHILR